MRRQAGPWVGLAVAVLRPLLLTWTRREWRGREHVPRTGGVVLVANHTSYADPLVVAHFVWEAGRVPRFLAKASLFTVPGVGRVLRGAGQIPVLRHTADARLAFVAAVTAVQAGECVVVYPEGTITRDPEGWPMAGKTGAARVALTTGAPVVAVAQWGAHGLLPPGARRPRLGRRRVVRVAAFPPVELGDLAPPRGQEVSAEQLRVATDRIMAALTAAVAELRPGEQPPQRRSEPTHSSTPRREGAA